MPTVPGTKGLVTSEEDALKESEKLGYPVMLKATAGGGGMGLVVCRKSEVRTSKDYLSSAYTEDLDRC